VSVEVRHSSMMTLLYNWQFAQSTAPPTNLHDRVAWLDGLPRLSRWLRIVQRDLAPSECLKLGPPALKCVQRKWLLWRSFGQSAAGKVDPGCRISSNLQPCFSFPGSAAASKKVGAFSASFLHLHFLFHTNILSQKPSLNLHARLLVSLLEQDCISRTACLVSALLHIVCNPRFLARRRDLPSALRCSSFRAASPALSHVPERCLLWHRITLSLLSFSISLYIFSRAIGPFLSCLPSSNHFALTASPCSKSQPLTTTSFLGQSN
jgi:hypothetical protein